MFRKIMIILIFIAMVTFGILFVLERLEKSEVNTEYKVAEQSSVEKKDIKSNRTIIETINPENPNEIKMQWTGYDGLTYKLEAVKNDDGTYTGSLKGLNMYDGFIEYNFKFNQISQSGFDQLFYK